MPSFIDKGDTIKVIVNESGQDIKVYDKDGLGVFTATGGEVITVFDGEQVHSFPYEQVSAPNSTSLSDLIDTLNSMRDGSFVPGLDVTGDVVRIDGINRDVDGSVSTLWSEGGIYTYPAAASIMTVSSSSASDNLVGTGLRTVKIEGLTDAFIPIEETVILSGQTPVNTVNSYFRINKMTGVSAGSTELNLGDVYIGTGAVAAGVPATIYNKIDLGLSQSTVGVYTVPANNSLQVTDQFLSVSDGDSVAFRLAVSDRTAANPVTISSSETTINDAAIVFNSVTPLEIPEKTDISFTAFGEGAVNNIVKTTFLGRLISE